ncbi:lysophospholipid acyltransferase family protein [Methylocella silvestris]|uniref:lysophospholipid acyltransferase family protein n=1 Tax=Methylocella silvestris TaxID=199596 RepID=UPI0015E0F1E6|nr:lysophospholipid acyltransferase family protein [Methylocella silvestris]
MLAFVVFLCIGIPAQSLAARLRRPARVDPSVVFCRVLIRVLRVKISVSGAACSSRPLLLAANHVSWIDVLALGSLSGFSFLAKREVGSWPLIGAIARQQGTVFVDRKRRRSIPAANAAMAERMLEGRRVLLFPEGTTGDGRALGAFRSSHFASARDLLAGAVEVEDVAVQPVAICYSALSAAWLGDAALLPHLWQVLTGEPLRCKIIFGAPLRFARGADRKIIAREAGSRVAHMLAASPALAASVQGRTLEAARTPAKPVADPASNAEESGAGRREQAWAEE